LYFIYVRLVPILSVKRKVILIKKIVVLDSAYGGWDFGILSSKLAKDCSINLEIALRVKAYLDTADELEVIIPCNHDTVLCVDEETDFLKWLETLEIIEEAKPSSFISIACNENEDHAVHGPEIKYSTFDGRSRQLAHKIYALLPAANGVKGNGVHGDNNIPLLEAVRYPACLVKAGYISNEQEEKLLRQSEFQDRTAWAIAQGVAVYLGVHIRASEVLPVSAVEAKECPYCHRAM